MNGHMTSRRVVAVALTALVGGFVPVATPGAAHGADDHPTAYRAVPFSGTIDGVHTSRTPLTPPVFEDRFDLGGQATLLGQMELVIESTVDFGARPVTGFGTMTFTAADGDRLVAEQTGASTLVAPGSVLITEHAVIDPDLSTGRFAGAEGTFVVERLADAATGVGGRTSGSFTGSVVLPRSGQD